MTEAITTGMTPDQEKRTAEVFGKVYTAFEDELRDRAQEEIDKLSTDEEKAVLRGLTEDPPQKVVNDDALRRLKSDDDREYLSALFNRIRSNARNKAIREAQSNLDTLPTEVEKKRLMDLMFSTIGATLTHSISDEVEEGEKPAGHTTQGEGLSPEQIKEERGKWRTKFRESDIVDLPSNDEFRSITQRIRSATTKDEFDALELTYAELKAKAAEGNGADAASQEAARLAALKAALAKKTGVHDSAGETLGGIKKRARKRVVLGRKSDDSQDDGADDTSTGIRPGTQERLKSVLALRKDKYNIPDDVIKSLSDQIDGASTAADLKAIEDQINKDFGTEYGKKKTGKRKSARTGSGDIDVGEKKGRKVSMERMPDGRMKFITIEPDGTTTERIEGEEARTTNAVLEETPPEAWEEFGRTHGDSMREEERSAAARAEHDARYREEIARWESRGPVKRFFDMLRGVQPPRAPEVYTLLNTPGLSPEVREAILATEQATRAMYARQDRDAAERGVTNRWDRIKGRFKGAGKAVLFGVTAATVFGLFATGAGIPAALTLPKLLGVAAGALTSTYVRNANEEAGRNGFASKYLMPWLVGTLAGVGTGAIATGISDLISSQFGNGNSVHTLVGGSGQAAPAGSPSVAQMIPAAPPGFDTGDFGALGNKLIVTAGDNIWSQVTDGLCEQSLLDTKGRAAFADAFYRTVEDGRFKDLFLSYNGRPLGSGVSWNNLPVGTVANYQRLFSNPQFVDMLVDRIGDNYPSLLRKINSGGFSAFDFIRGVAYSHGVRV